jgi:hypothetical protein
MDIRRVDSDCPDSVSGFKPILKLGSSDSPIVKILARNLGYMVSTVMPSIEDHVKRMNANSFSKVPNKAPFKCFNSEEI